MTAVIFDMDGVVVDSERHWAALEAAQILPTAVDSDAVTPDEIAGLNVTDLYAYLDDEYGTTVSQAAFRELYDEAATELYTERATLLDGLESLLETLAAREVSLALASSSPRDWIELVFDRFDLHDAFRAVVSAEDIDARSKPDPTIYEHTADLLSVHPRDCVAVEDSDHGVEAAVSAGMTAIGYRPAWNDQSLSAADTVVTDSNELLRELLDRT